VGGVCQHLQVEALRSQLAQWEGAAWRHALADPASAERAPVVSSGCPALDRILPYHGFRCGTLVEWLSSGPGSGAATLAFRAAVQARSPLVDGGAVVVLDSSGEFYPPAAIAQGIEPARLIVVHPGNSADHAWALDQALRCPAVAATVAWPDSVCSTGSSRNRNDMPAKAGTTSALGNGKRDTRAFRRWQLAAEQGGGLGLLIRPASVRGEPSWADVRLLVEPLVSRDTREVGRRRMRVVLLHCRNGRGEQTVEVEIDDEPHCLP
jgi:protein ImuA